MVHNLILHCLVLWNGPWWLADSSAPFRTRLQIPTLAIRWFPSVYEPSIASAFQSIEKGSGRDEKMARTWSLVTSQCPLAVESKEEPVLSTDCRQQQSTAADTDQSRRLARWIGVRSYSSTVAQHRKDLRVPTFWCSIKRKVLLEIDIYCLRSILPQEDQLRTLLNEYAKLCRAFFFPTYPVRSRSRFHSHHHVGYSYSNIAKWPKFATWAWASDSHI